MREKMKRIRGFLVVLMIFFVIVKESIAFRVSDSSEMALQIEKNMKAYADPTPFTFPPISTILRMTAPELVEKVETLYFSAIDYQVLSLRSLRFAKEFLRENNLSKANEYLERAERYYKLATAICRGSYDVLDTTYDAAQWMVIYKASKTALGFTVTGTLGVAGSTIFDTGTLYTDFLLDKSIVSQEEAKKRLISKAISSAFHRFTGIAETTGDIVKHGWGSSRAYPVLQKIIGTSEFKDAVMKEFMRLGGDIGDHVSKKVIE